jgi:hypothetical protein
VLYADIEVGMSAREIDSRTLDAVGDEGGKRQAKRRRRNEVGKRIYLFFFEESSGRCVRDVGREE